MSSVRRSKNCSPKSSLGTPRNKAAQFFWENMLAPRLDRSHNNYYEILSTVIPHIPIFLLPA